MTRNLEVHVAHCCVRHTCKYFEENCPVRTGEVEQDTLCEVCDMMSDTHWFAATKTEYWQGATPEERVFLAKYDPTKFAPWLVTVDMVVLAVSEKDATKEPYVLLVKRGNFPYKDMWALPGGFINAGENPREAAIRELSEEAGLPVEWAAQVGAFGAVGRDPRGNSVSIAHMSVVPLNGRGMPPKVKYADDAVDAKWFPYTETKNLELAFDHDRIIAMVMEPESGETR